MSKTITIAASDSPTNIKSHADYICNGTNDETTLSKATNELPDGGILFLHKGNFHIGTTKNQVDEKSGEE